ncbi:MAG: HD domain-containing protein [Bacteroidales bacterium]|nr:HD domain-containing protein [Bacteroidales bacterium]
MKIKIDKELKDFYSHFEAAGFKAYLVGGAVRDIFLHKKPHDFDVATNATPQDVMKLFRTVIPTGFEHGTVTVHHSGLEIEVTTFRTESGYSDGRHPDSVNYAATIEEDLARRDFTINALAISLNKRNFGELVDPFNGIQDLENKIIRTPLDSDITYSDDPLRMMRAIRFATQLHFMIEGESFDAIRRNAQRIKIISMERVTEEMNKIIMSDVPSIGFKLLDKSGLLPLIFPQMAALKGVEIQEGKGHKDNFYHTLEVLDNVALSGGNLWLRWAAVLHDIAKPLTKRFEKEAGWTFHGHEVKGAKMVHKIFANFKLPLNEKMKYVEKLVYLHLRPIVLAQDIVTDSAVRRLLFDAGDDIDDLMTLCDADITSKNEEKKARFHNNFQIVRRKLKEIEAKDHLRNWQPPVDGTVIMKTFGIPECRDVGVIKTAIREAILDGIIGNNFAEAYQFMKAEGEKIGLKVVCEVTEPVEVKSNGPVPVK